VGASRLILFYLPLVDILAETNSQEHWSSWQDLRQEGVID